MKMIICLIFALFQLQSSICFATETQIISANGHQKGRYQIIPVEYQAMTVNGEVLKKTVLKLDVTTGQTWILMDVGMKINGKLHYIRDWEEIEKRKTFDDSSR